MKPEPPSAVVVNERDNVATSLRTLRSGDAVGLKVGSSTVDVMLRDGIIPGHKFAIVEIKRGDHIIKFGQVIGQATRDIKAGEHVHVHNVASLHGRSGDSGDAPRQDSVTA